MSFKKIHIIGGPGSGKSYMAKKLARELNYPKLQLDDIYWDNTFGRKYGEVKENPKTRDTKLNDFLKNNKEYIIEGVYYTWLSKSFAAADIIIVLDINVFVRMYRIIKRYLRIKDSRARIWNMIKYNWSWNKDNFLPIREMLKNNPKVVYFTDSNKAYDYIINKQ